MHKTHKIRKILKVFFVILVCFSLFISSIYIYIAIKGKIIIEDSLESLFKKEVIIGGFKINPPLHIALTKVEIKDCGTIEQIYISPNLLGFLTLKIAIDNIVVSKPNLIFNRQKEELTISLLSSKQAEAKEEPKVGFKLKFPLFIKNVKIKNGKVEIIDKVISEGGLKIKIDSFEFSLRNFSLPARPIKTTYKIKGIIPWETIHQEGLIDGEGWINFAKKDMEGEINLRDIDGTYLSPYYNNYVSLGDLNVEKASLDFLTTLNSRNNDLLIRSHLELKNLVFRKLKDSQKDSKEDTAQKMLGTVFAVFGNVGGKIVLDFNIKTKFDRPRMGLENIKVAIEDKFSKKVLK